MDSGEPKNELAGKASAARGGFFAAWRDWRRGGRARPRARESDMAMAGGFFPSRLFLALLLLLTARESEGEGDNRWISHDERIALIWAGVTAH